MSVLNVERLSKKYGERYVVNDISFTLQPNTSTALIGANGAGKTTTMSMITGLLAPTSGVVSLEGSKDIRADIGFLPQYPQFYSWLSALEYVEMVAKLSGLVGREVKEKSERVLQYVGLEKHMKRLTSTFSGGMKQRLGIAQAIVHSPKLLLLDEPVSALDPIGRAEVMNLLKELQQHTTILYSTHILHDAEQMTDQLLFMKEGNLVEQGSLVDIQKRYADPHFIVHFVTVDGANQFAAHIGQDAVASDNKVTVPISPTINSMSKLMDVLVKYDCEVRKVEQASASLDQIFMKVALDHEVMASSINKGI